MQDYKDKIDINRKLKNRDKIILELGCGNRKKQERINIDKLDLEGVDIVADLEKGFSFFPDSCVDEIHSKSLFEHIENFEFFMEEIYRILKPGGKVFIFVPHFSNPYFYSDPTHKRFMGFYFILFFIFLKIKN
jgi:predicted SAM-dependent methyltransferase